jgi:hypothetical protein
MPPTVDVEPLSEKIERLRRSAKALREEKEAKKTGVPMLSTTGEPSLLATALPSSRMPQTAEAPPLRAGCPRQQRLLPFAIRLERGSVSVLLPTLRGSARKEHQHRPTHARADSETSRCEPSPSSMLSLPPTLPRAPPPKTPAEANCQEKLKRA